VATKKGGSTKVAAKKGGAKKQARGSGKRETIKNPTGNYYGKRDKGGEFSEMDEIGPSQRADRRQKAKKTVKPGYGDQGDQKVRKGGAKKGGAKKS
jgi:hypothetical protein